MLDLIRANAQSWGVKIAFGIIILVFVFWGVGGLTGGPSTVILTVNGEPITIQEFQRKYERLAFELGGRNYHAPAQTVGDFLAGHASTALGKVAPSYAPGVTLTDLAGCLPGFAVTTLRSAIVIFDKRLRGYAQEDAVLTGVETRSSSPVRILRGENCQSNLKGLFPCGEGAGYAGGIMSAAVDGLRCAIALTQSL